MEWLDALRLRLLRLRHRLDRRYPRTVKMKVRGGPAVRFRVKGPRDRYDITSLGNEPHFVWAVLNRLKPEDAFYDIGAHVGLFSVLAAVRVDRVVAFEPDPTFVARIAENIDLNALTNVKIEHLAVGDEPGQAELWSRGLGGASPTLRPRKNQGRPLRVQVVDLDSYTSVSTWAAPDVIKIDVEGHESAVLDGAEGLVSGPDGPRMLALELHPGGLRKRGSSVGKIRRQLESWGFQLHWSRPRGPQMHEIWERL